MAKKETPKTVLERTYNVPLRKEFQKVPHWKKTKKAVKALREFLAKHMKSEDVRLSKELNEKVWQHGIRNPPHHVKVSVTKDNEGIVKANLFGAKKKEKKFSKKQVKKVELSAAKEEVKSEVKTEAKPKREEAKEKKVSEEKKA